MGTIKTESDGEAGDGEKDELFELEPDFCSINTGFWNGKNSATPRFFFLGPQGEKKEKAAGLAGCYPIAAADMLPLLPGIFPCSLLPEKPFRGRYISSSLSPLSQWPEVNGRDDQ
jgi:hypothetical protein